MSLKTVAFLCALSFAATAVWSIGTNVYYFATTDFYDVYSVMRNIPYMTNHVFLAIFFFLFSRRM